MAALADDQEATVRDPLLTIGVFSRRSRVSVKALRLYDRQEVLVPAHVDPDTGYRYYRESQLESARLLVKLRRLDMPLELIRQVLAADRIEAVELVASYWDGVERRLAYQRELAAHLWVEISGFHGGYPDFTIATRDVPEQLLLIRLDAVTQPELEPYITGGLADLREEALRFGGAVARAMVLYHGVIDEDSDGPVEIAVPIDPAIVDTGDVPSRREPAHREVFTRITRAQAEYPQILSAYDAIEHWISRNGAEPIGFPREIYLVEDFATADPDDIVCEIARPIV